MVVVEDQALEAAITTNAMRKTATAIAAPARTRARRPETSLAVGSVTELADVMGVSVTVVDVRVGLVIDLSGGERRVAGLDESIPALRWVPEIDR